MRDSNIEALRIVAMFLILMVHVNFFSIGEPSTEEAIEKPLSTFSRCFFESISLVGVNLFVLISGWFSIKFTFRRLWSFVFQAVSIITVVYLIGLLTGYASVNEIQIKECLFLSRQGWFIKAYIGLMIFSPLLNYYIANASKKEYEVLLVCFFSFQTIYSCFTDGATFIQYGYSTFSFVGLYLLARYVRIYGHTLINRAGIFCLISFVGYVAWGYLPVRFGVMRIFYMSLHYTNPLNIALALGLLLITVNRKPCYNKIINYIASSTFAVYLCHMCNTWSANLYKEYSIEIYNSFSGVKYLVWITAFMIVIFVISVLIDQPRKWIWSLMGRFTPPPLLSNVNMYTRVINIYE